MSTIIFINTMQIQQGRLEEFKESIEKAIRFVGANGPQLTVEVYLDEKNMMAYSFQLYRDSESILSHWQMSSPYIRDVMQHSTVKRLDIYGDPDDAVLDGVRGFPDDGVTVTVTPHHYGFSRLRASD